MSKRSTLILLFISTVVLASGAFGQELFPSKPVRILVPYPAGGPSDVLARAIALKLQDSWGKPVIVDNRPGGGGQIAVQALKQSEADGHTLFMGGTETHVINQTLFKTFSYDPLLDFKYVGSLYSMPMILVVPKDLPVNSVTELVEYARKKPQGMNYASQGVGTIGHMLGQQFIQRVGVQMNHVPYRGAMPALQDLVGGQPEMIFDVQASSGPLIAAGKLKSLAIASSSRSHLMPQIATMAEAGYPGLEASVWFAMAAKAGTPDDVVSTINNSLSKVLQSPDFVKRFSDLGWNTSFMPLVQFNSFMRVEITRWGSLVKASGATAD